jgi:hypothetical protein
MKNPVLSISEESRNPTNPEKPRITNLSITSEKPAKANGKNKKRFNPASAGLKILPAKCFSFLSF